MAMALLVYDRVFRRTNHADIRRTVSPGAQLAKEAPSTMAEILLLAGDAAETNAIPVFSACVPARRTRLEMTAAKPHSSCRT
jgi:hypothetical protein